MNVAWAAYRIVAPCVGALAPAARIFRPPAERPHWNERLGRVELPGGCQAWIHAASLGESLGVLPLARALQTSRPTARLFLTATTESGRARLESTGLPVSLAPIDSPQAVRRFVSGIRPERLILIETELWPHWLLHARSGEIPVAVVSARLAERSLMRYRRLGRRFESLIAGLEAVLCQTDADRERWLSLGARAERTAVVGNLKDDALPSPVPCRSAARASLGLDRDRPLLVLGSLRPGEVDLLTRAWKRLPDRLRERWQVVAVIRHPRSAHELRAEAEALGQGLVIDRAPRQGAWRWEERIGVLKGYYAAADVAFVGGSLRPYGGHNPLEPAAGGAAVLMGPHFAAQADQVRALTAGHAIAIAGSLDELSGHLLVLLGNDEMRKERGEAARQVAAARRGAAVRVVARLGAWGLWP